MKLILARISPLITVIALLSLINTGCQSKSKDADIKTAIETKFKNDPIAAHITADVKDGIVTLSGECMNDPDKENLTRIAETIPYVKSVVNNCSVAGNSDDFINNKISQIISDYPYIKIGAMNGIVSVAGGLKKEEWQRLKTYVDNLHPKGYDTAMLRIE